MVEAFTYTALPSRVSFGRGALAGLRSEVDRLGGARALVLTTPEQAAEGDRLKELLGSIYVGSFAQAAMHTPTDVTDLALSVFAELNADCVVAIGGGSTIGLSKALAHRTGVNQVVIPTTYAGSEMTPILGETAAGRKTTIRSVDVLPETVIYDVDLTTSLPSALTAASGLNAMAHAVEALYAQDRSPVVSLMAEEGLRALAAALPILMKESTNMAARSDALYGAWLCGCCLGAVGMSLHHKLCHTLGGSFALPHAETHAVVLPHVVAYNAPAAPAAMSAIARALGTAEPADGLFDLARGLNIPCSLADLGMPADGVELAARLAVNNPYWNPRPIVIEGVTHILSAAHSGARPSPFVAAQMRCGE